MRVPGVEELDGIKNYRAGIFVLQTHLLVELSVSCRF